MDIREKNRCVLLWLEKFKNNIEIIKNVNQC